MAFDLSAYNQADFDPAYWAHMVAMSQVEIPPKPTPPVQSAPPVVPPAQVKSPEQENVYKDASGVIRNRVQDPGNPAASQPNRSARIGRTASGDFGSDNGLTATTSGQSSNTWTTGGGSRGGSQGGGMATNVLGPGQVRNQYANLAGSVWNNVIPTSSAGFAGQAGGYAGQAGAMSPNLMAPERTLYDKYSNILQDPAQIANDPAYQFMLQQAQQASGRQLAAGRMSKSGNAAIQAAKVATGTAGNYLRDLSSIYGAGAAEERSRYGTEAGLGLEAYKAHAGTLLGAGQLANQTGQTANLDAQNALKAREIDLARVKEGIQTPGQQAQTQYTNQMNAYNNQPTYNPMTTFGATMPNYSVPQAPNLSTSYGWSPAFAWG